MKQVSARFRTCVLESRCLARSSSRPVALGKSFRLSKLQQSHPRNGSRDREVVVRSPRASIVQPGGDPVTLSMTLNS